MAFEDSYTTRIHTLVKNPKNGIKKVIPFLKSRVTPYYRTFLEKMGIYILTIPYFNHNEFSTVINFKKGFFVQCGGNDGYSNDPTYFLEKVLGWSGIIAEPLPIYKLCRFNRSKSIVYNCATGPLTNTPNATTTFVDCNSMSFVEGSIDNQEEWIKAGEKTQNIKAKYVTVPIKPVQELINDYMCKHGSRKIDLFVADTEGYEFSIIQGLDFKINSPEYILLEIHKETELIKITKYLEDKGYKLLKEMRQRDFIFKLKS